MHHSIPVEKHHLSPCINHVSPPIKQIIIPSKAPTFVASSIREKIKDP